jgi:hypothetical protein
MSTTAKILLILLALILMGCAGTPYRAPCAGPLKRINPIDASAAPAPAESPKSKEKPSS